MKKTAAIALAAYIAPFAAWADYPEMAVSFVVPFPPSDIAATNPLALALVHRAPVGVVGIANGTDYGLASAVWTANQSRAHRMIPAIRAEVVHVNTHGGADMTLPLGDSSNRATDMAHRCMHLASISI